MDNINGGRRDALTDVERAVTYTPRRTRPARAGPHTLQKRRLWGTVIKTRL